MRHPRAQQCVILAAYLAVCAASKADGWATNAWPSQQFPRQGKTQLSDVWSSTVERCQAAGVSTPSAPVWYRSERTTLANCKAKLSNAIPRYIDTDWTTSSGNTNYAQYFKDNTNAKGMPTWTFTGILWACQMPTNWLSYTPRRSLTGLGGSTNDASVAWPHGETNAYTASGGGNYPAGRSMWYSSDYGYASMSGLIAKLRHVQVAPVVSDGRFHDGIYVAWDRGHADPTFVWANYANAVSEMPKVDDHWVPSDYPYTCSHFGDVIGYGNFWWYWNSGNSGLGMATAAKWSTSVPILTNRAFDASYYMNTLPYAGPTGAGSHTFPSSALSNEMAFVYDTSPVASFEGYDALYTVTNWTKSAADMGATGTLSETFGDNTSPVTRYGLATATANHATNEPYVSSKGWWFKDTHLMILKYDFAYR